MTIMTKDDVIIQVTTREDLPMIRTILNGVIVGSDYYLSDELKTEDDITLWYEEHQNSTRYAIFSAFIENSFAGWVSLSPFRRPNGYNSTAELSVYIHPDYYGKGIGSTLMDYIEKFAKETTNLHCIISVITANNKPSIALHKKHGYETVGILNEIAYKNGRYADVVMMTKLV